jgi:hypothetical protein
MNVHYTVVWSNCGCCCAANSDGVALFEVVATLPSHGLLALSAWIDRGVDGFRIR